MIPPAPSDFWMQVVARVATLVFERETALSAGVRLQGTGLVTNAERAVMHPSAVHSGTHNPGSISGISPAPAEASK